MLEPVQNCFTFYHPDGISSAHEYVEHDEVAEKKEIEPKSKSMIAQQSLPLPSSPEHKDS